VASNEENFIRLGDILVLLLVYQIRLQHSQGVVGSFLIALYTNNF